MANSLPPSAMGAFWRVLRDSVGSRPLAAFLEVADMHAWGRVSSPNALLRLWYFACGIRRPGAVHPLSGLNARVFMQYFGGSGLLVVESVFRGNLSRSNNL